MGCCGSSEALKVKPDSEHDENKPYVKGSANDVSGGPVSDDERGCTDLWCLFVLIAFAIIYIVVSLAGVADGNPVKLYRPRDWKGDYCGVETNWNSDADLSDHGSLSYTMNVANTMEDLALEVVCSTTAENSLYNILSAENFSDYSCACCKTPCASCDGSLDQTDYTSSSALSNMISGRMAEFTDPAMVQNLYSAGGANGDFFTSIWESVTVYFHNVCTKDCGSVTKSTPRSYTYAPPPDKAWSYAWYVLKTDPAVDQDIQESIQNNFTFAALSRSECPYDAKYCVPFPGVYFSELMSGYCLFQVSSDVLYSIGDDMAKTLQDYATSDLADAATEEVGEQAGALYETIEATIATMMTSFVIGMVFMVLLRYLVWWVVWGSIVLIVMLLLLTGGAFYARSEQCAGASLFDSGKTLTSNGITLATNAAVDAVTGSTTGSEDMSGDGSDYRGAQTQTRSGLTCQAWDAQTPWPHSTNSTSYPDAGLDSNYCRNPTEASTIWCYTTDSSFRWELCSPLSISQVECPNGYYVTSETARDAMKIIGYIWWGLAGLLVIVIVCVSRQINLAIKINQVAALFIINQPAILFVPIVQILTGLIWTLLWSLSVSFLLSQVPDGYTPKDSYATYDEAYGTSTKIGACTSKAISGFVWEQETETGIVYRCAQPRYIVDGRSWFSIFFYLWLMWLWVAIGQFVVASAVSIWFFTERTKKWKVKTIRKSIRRVWRFHLGSLAFGSFIIAVVTFLRIVAKYLEKHAKAQKNRVMEVIMKVVQCFLWCFEKCLKFLNKNAYIQIALMGTNFCVSAKAAFFLILRNAIRFGAAAFLGSIIHRLGFLFITASTGVLGYFMLNLMFPDASPILPVCLYVCIGYMVSKLFMNVFGLAVDTSLQCFIAIEEMDYDRSCVPTCLIDFFPKKTKKGWFS